MAKVIVKNVREHDIDVFATTKSGVERVTIPAGTFNESDKSIVAGEASVEADFLAAARKGSAAVEGMFTEGWLSVNVPRAAVTQTDGGQKQPDGGKA